MERVHASCVAVADGANWAAVLLSGPSGAGKSDLALRLIDAGAVLVADDQVELSSEGGVLIARAPETIAGRIEVRGVGLMEVPFRASAPVALVCALCEPSEVPRLPEYRTRRLSGIEIPLLALAPFEASAMSKVRLGLEAARQGILAR